MSDGAHLLIPFAASGSEGSFAARRALRLPPLDKLLARLRPVGADEGDKRMLSLPPDRVIGRVVDPWLPRSDRAKTVRRLQQEMQMLLYTHDVNEERTRRGLPAVNSFWVSGTGALPDWGAPSPPSGLSITHYLRDTA